MLLESGNMLPKEHQGKWRLASSIQVIAEQGENATPSSSFLFSFSVPALTMCPRTAQAEAIRDRSIREKPRPGISGPGGEAYVDHRGG
jgi:hypothetical protein